MAYRRPGVTVTQEFVGLVPALAAFSLPSVAIGPAYHLVDNDLLGSYAGAETLFPYASALSGEVVDLEKLPAGEKFPITKKPISAVLKDVEVQILAEQTTGAVAGDVFTDSDAFADVAAGDIVSITPTADNVIVAARTDGASSEVFKNRLTAASPTQFTSVKAGDSVVVTGAAPSIAGTFVVIAKVGTGLLILSADINDGSGPSTTVEYSITGNRGALNAGDYVVKSKTDASTLVLLTQPTQSESPLTYSIKRKVNGEVPLERVDALTSNGYVASADGLTLPTALTYEGKEIKSADLYASYRALRIDLASEVKQYNDLAAVKATFGATQIHPANPLAYALSIMLQNTVTPVNGLGLDANAATNESLAHTAALDVLKRIDMYALAPLSQSPVIHTMYKNHIEQMSIPNRKLERVVIINSALVEKLTLQDDLTTVTTALGAREIVGMQVDGSGVFATAPNKLVDGTAGQFAGVAKGDHVVVAAGTGVTTGTYTVVSINDENTLTLSGNFITAGTPIDIQYYIYRQDGLAAGGASFYDRQATFLSNGVAAGHYFEILSGTYAGRYKIATVVSEREITLVSPITSALSFVAAVTYEINKDLEKPAQADAVKGYSESLSSRRVVHCWPDVLQVPIGQTIYDVPGYYGCCSIAALTTGLPTQQGFTNLSVSGFLGFKHSTRYFTEEELDVIADGGTFIFAQDGASQPLYVRHQLTTDRSAIKFQEYSITKNVDFIGKFLRNTYAGFVGQYNIVDTTIDALKMTAEAAIKFLKENTRIPRFGGVVRSGSLVSLVESETQIDTVEIKFSFAIPVPLNYIDITIEV